MKKLFALIAMSVLALSLTACGLDSDADEMMDDDASVVEEAVMDDVAPAVAEDAAVMDDAAPAVAEEAVAE